jgi:hypothetical protein
VLPLDSLTSSYDCEREISTFFRDAKRSKLSTAGIPTNLLLIVVDHTIITPSQLNFAKRTVDKMAANANLTKKDDGLWSSSEGVEESKGDVNASNGVTGPAAGNRHKSRFLVVFLIHIPSNRLLLRPIHHAISFSNWDYMFVDSFDSPTSSISSDHSMLNFSAAADPRIWLDVAFGLTVSVIFMYI